MKNESRGFIDFGRFVIELYEDVRYRITGIKSIRLINKEHEKLVAEIGEVLNGSITQYLVVFLRLFHAKEKAKEEIFTCLKAMESNLYALESPLKKLQQLEIDQRIWGSYHNLYLNYYNENCNTFKKMHQMYKDQEKLENGSDY